MCGLMTQHVQLLKKAVVVSLDFSEKKKFNSLNAEAGEPEPWTAFRNVDSPYMALRLLGASFLAC